MTRDERTMRQKQTKQTAKEPGRREVNRGGENRQQAAKTARRHRNREYAVVTYFFLIVFVGLIGYFLYFQFVKSDEFINSPYNSLQDLFSKNVVRGEIQTKDGHVHSTDKRSVQMHLRQENTLTAGCLRM